MLSLSVRVWACPGFFHQYSGVCLSVALFLCLLASGSGAVAAPKGLGGCLLVTSVSVVAPKTCSAKFISAHTSFLANSFFPFPTYKGVYDSWPWESERLQTPGRESDHMVIWFSIVQTGAFDGQLTQSSKLSKKALSLPK